MPAWTKVPLELSGHLSIPKLKNMVPVVSWMGIPIRQTACYSVFHRVTYSSGLRCPFRWPLPFGIAHVKQPHALDTFFMPRSSFLGQGVASRNPGVDQNPPMPWAVHMRYMFCTRSSQCRLVLPQVETVPLHRGQVPSATMALQRSPPRPDFLRLSIHKCRIPGMLRDTRLSEAVHQPRCCTIHENMKPPGLGQPVVGGPSPVLEHLFYGLPVHLPARKPFGRNAPSVEDPGWLLSLMLCRMMFSRGRS